MKLFLTGGEGQLGTELIRLAAASGIEIAAPTMAAMDLTDPGQVEAAFSAFRPAAVINAAAYTAVDRAETERELAFAVNAAAPAHLARLLAGGEPAPLRRIDRWHATTAEKLALLGGIAEDLQALAKIAAALRERALAASGGR